MLAIIDYLIRRAIAVLVRQTGHHCRDTMAAERKEIAGSPSSGMVSRCLSQGIHSYAEMSTCGRLAVEALFCFQKHQKRCGMG